MRRRKLITLVGGATMWPCAVAAQESGKVYRLGVLTTGSMISDQGNVEALRVALFKLGYASGKNMQIDIRYANGASNSLPSLATELLQLRPDAIIASGNPAIAVVKRATTTIPVIMGVNADAVGAGYVASLARPGGNVTGLTSSPKELSGKWLQLLKEAVPGLKRVAVVRNPSIPTNLVLGQGVAAAAQPLGIELIVVDITSVDRVASVLGALQGRHVGGVVFLPEQIMMVNAPQVVRIIAAEKLPAIYAIPRFVEVGGLMQYGAGASPIWARCAYYVDKVFRGANPGELPVELPTKFDLIVNLKTARALNLTLPQSLLIQADEVIK
jgi:putative tryptophan/tyrosine transport system substrate-binding protein